MKKREHQEEEMDFQDLVINTRCPITGNDFDPVELSASRIRRYKGQVIGFCSPDCPAEWDELSDEEKEDRLSDAMED